MAAAGFGLRKSGKSRAKSSTQGWCPNSGQATEDEPGSFVDVLVSDQDQQSSSSGLTLPQQQNQQAGFTDAVSLFTGSATEWFGSVPAFWEQPGVACSECSGSVPASREQ